MAFASYVFDGIDDVIQHVWSSTATDAERRTLTVSFWTKALGSPPRIALQAISGDETSYFIVVVGLQGPNPTLIIDSDAAFEQVILSVSPVSWHHYVIRIDTTQATEADRIRVYVDGTLQSAVIEGTLLDAITAYFLSGGLIEFGAITDDEFFTNCAFAFIDVVSGQSLGPDEFAFDDGGTWTRKPYKGSYGDWGFSLDGSQGFNDVSGNGYHFTNVGGVQLDPIDLPPHVAAEEGFSGIYLGETQINSIKLGSTDIKAVYLGSTKIFEA